MIIQRGITEGGVETLTRTPRFCSLAWQKPALSVPSVSDEAGLHQAAQACETQGAVGLRAPRLNRGGLGAPCGWHDGGLPMDGQSSRATSSLEAVGRDRGYRNVQVPIMRVKGLS